MRRVAPQLLAAGVPEVERWDGPALPRFVRGRLFGDRYDHVRSGRPRENTLLAVGDRTFGAEQPAAAVYNVRYSGQWSAPRLAVIPQVDVRSHRNLSGLQRVPE